ncbi:hypothetical protein BV394_07375 [Brevirhabdus pacifica]|uniref:Uncharacterized protein n=1 Tax=Brevirhabdus pacifica TaxID=1267768 RepID=A0A1U7DI00_9RHOB|nr:hypothetical protein [Brevirhabdus pacifica]APX89555.1 hypothetical protein BV394_07375 [Brevirhabdus pacifica]OWU76439.1 hypothetical protein ATO5_08920 [Loktanella sp. 22II-4b]PJJ85781.1 hypothetical protein CLV77_0310 [Brevirhabdus pacifica]
MYYSLTLAALLVLIYLARPILRRRLRYLRNRTPGPVLERPFSAQFSGQLSGLPGGGPSYSGFERSAPQIRPMPRMR